MTANQYRQQLNAKWSTIQDPITRELVIQLLEYAQNLENQRVPINNPENIKFVIRPKGDKEDSQAFRRNIDFSFLPGQSAEEAGDTVGVLVEQLLNYTEDLEQKT